MIKRTLYFGNPAYLCTSNEQMVVKLPEVERNETIPEQFKQNNIKTIPIEDIGVIVLDHQQITTTHSLLEKLLDVNAAVITCDKNHLPVGLLLPLCGNTLQNERFREQLDASAPLRKQLWQQTIQAKICNQAALLKYKSGQQAKNMIKWANDVKSGDTDNMEARAAAFYWKTLFSDISNFTRGRDGDPPNNLLNYGYAILRAIIARSLVCAGLLPTLGIHHHNRYNAYCLADDVMEPYRPYVDKIVLDIVNSNMGYKELTKEIKFKIIGISLIEVVINKVRSPLMIATQKTANSLYKCFSGEQRKILFPEL